MSRSEGVRPRRPPLSEDEPTVLIGCKVPISYKNRIAAAAKQLGMPNTSELVRIVLLSWLKSYDAQN